MSTASMTEGCRLLRRVIAVHTQQVVARRIGVQQSAISRWANGLYKPHAYCHRSSFLKHYGIPLDAWDEPAKREAGADDKNPSPEAGCPSSGRSA